MNANEVALPRSIDAALGIEHFPEMRMTDQELAEKVADDVTNIQMTHRIPVTDHRPGMAAQLLPSV